MQKVVCPLIQCKDTIRKDLRKLFSSGAKTVHHFTNTIESNQEARQLQSPSRTSISGRPASKRPCLEGSPLTGSRIPSCLQFSKEELQGIFSVTLTNKKEDYDMFNLYYHELAHLSSCSLGCDVSQVIQFHHDSLTMHVDGSKEDYMTYGLLGLKIVM